MIVNNSVADSCARIVANPEPLGSDDARGVGRGRRSPTAACPPSSCRWLVGVDFSFAVSSVTATVVNTAPTRLACMAAAAAGMVRDFGFAMGPALIGAIALSKAAGNFNHTIAGVPRSPRSRTPPSAPAPSW